MRQLSLDYITREHSFMASCEKLKQDQFLKLSRELEKYHSVFYTLWELSKPQFTKDIDTAAISFDQNGEYIDFLFNPDFWEKLTDYEKSFVICHECLHVILKHGIRTKNSINKMASNVTIDIVVNHTLVNNFGFDRKKVTKDLCWTDTVFPGENIPDNKNFEYYFNLLKSKSNCSVATIDNHDGMSESNWDNVIKKAGELLNETERDSLQTTLEQAGTQAGNIWVQVDTSSVQKKRKWETVIKRWSEKYTKNGYADVEQWARVNRRLAILSNNLFLPSEMEIEDKGEDKKKVVAYFFQDTSGSCYHFRNRFFKAAKSLPTDRFDVKLFCFDTRVYKTSLESGKLYGFGGTSFGIIESYVQRNIKLT